MRTLDLARFPLRNAMELWVKYESTLDARNVYSATVHPVRVLLHFSPMAFEERAWFPVPATLWGHRLTDWNHVSVPKHIVFYEYLRTMLGRDLADAISLRLANSALLSQRTNSP